METNASFTLINGKFEPTDALPLVSNLYNAKIEYHNRKLLRSHEAYGNQNSADHIRVTELENSRLAFSRKMKEAADQGYQVEIKSTIEVSFIQKEPKPV